MTKLHYTFFFFFFLFSPWNKNIHVQAGFFKKPRLWVSHFTWRRPKKQNKKRNWCVRPGVSCSVPSLVDMTAVQIARCQLFNWRSEKIHFRKSAFVFVEAVFCCFFLNFFIDLFKSVCIEDRNSEKKKKKKKKKTARTKKVWSDDRRLW